MGTSVKRIRTEVSEPEMAQAIIQAWSLLFGNPPTKDQVNLILAQNALETGNRKSMWNYNVGNLTTDGKGPFDFFNDLSTNEQISPGVWKKMNLKYRSYPNLIEGVKDYLRLLSGKHYSEAWKHIINPDPQAFSKGLKDGGYYTANEVPYTKTLTNIYNNVSKSDSYYQAMSGKVNSTQSASMLARQEPKTKTYGFSEILDELAHMFSSTATYDISKKTYQKLLPNHNVLIQISASDYTDAIEFSRILCAALDEELKAFAYPHTDGDKVEVECCIAGPSLECLQTVEQLSQSLSDVFHLATKKIGGVVIKTNCVMNKKSSYQEISLRTADTNYRKFLLKFI